MGRPGFPVGASAGIEELTTNPHPVLARLREHEPVSWIDVFDGWLVTNRDLCVAVMRDADTFTVDDPRFSTARVIGPSMLSLDGADHLRHRTPFVDPFRARAVRSRFEAEIRHIAREIVASISPAGQADLRGTLAGPLAVQVMSLALHLDGVDATELIGWYDEIVAAVDAVTVGDELPEAGSQAFDALRSAVGAGMSRSPLLSAVHDRGSLTTLEIVSNVAVLLFGGIVTTESTVASLFRYLLSEPDALQRVDADRALLPNAVEEALRLEPAAAVVDRYATSAVELGGAFIEEGDLVRVSLAGAGRDPAVFEEPDRFLLERPNSSQHLAFAVGPHACIGLHLARLEAEAAVEAALSLLPGLRAGSDGLAEAEGLIFRAPPAVPAAWDPT